MASFWVSMLVFGGATWNIHRMVSTISSVQRPLGSAFSKRPKLWLPGFDATFKDHGVDTRSCGRQGPTVVVGTKGHGRSSSVDGVMTGILTPGDVGFFSVENVTFL